MSLPSYLSRLPLLHQAAALGDLCLVETLCADFDIQEPYRSRRPLDWACWHGEIEAARFLLDSGDDGRPTDYDPNFDSGGLGPIHYAVLADSIPLAELLLSRGVPLDEQTDLGSTPLHLARSGRMARTLIALVREQSKWSIDNQNDEGITPVYSAARSGHSTVLQCLLQAGARTSSESAEDGRSPPHYAARNRHLRCCDLLLKAGVDINVLDMYDSTPLDEALRHRGICDANRHISLDVFVPWMLERGARARRVSPQEIDEIMRGDDDGIAYW